MYIFSTPARLQSLDMSEPFRAAAWNAFVADTNGKFSYSPNSVVDGGDNTCGGGNNRFCTPRPGDRYDYLEVLIPQRDAIMYLGVRFGFEGDIDIGGGQTLGVKVIELIKHLTVTPATRMEPFCVYASSGDGVPYPIELYITLSGVLYGASFVLDYWQTYEPASLGEFKTWVATFMASLKTSDPQTANKRTWYTLLWLCCAVIVDDAAEISSALEFYTNRFNNGVQGHYMADNGTILDDRKRVGATTGGLFYSAYAMNAMALVCQVGSLNGHDVWTYTGGQGDNLELCADAHVPFALDQTGDAWRALGYQQQSMAVANTELAGFYELMHARFRKPEYKQVVDLLTRPVNYRVSGPITLTHGIEVAKLTAQQQREVLNECMRELNARGIVTAETKPNWRTLIDSIDTAVDTEAATLNGYIPQPQRGAFTNEEKALVMEIVTSKRYLI